MPLEPGMKFGDIVSEIIHSWRKSGKIGNIHPRNAKHAQEIAKAIAAKRTGVARG